MLGDRDGISSAGGFKIVKASQYLFKRARLAEHFNAVAQVLDPNAAMGSRCHPAILAGMGTVARKKPLKPAEHRWQISLIKATPAKHLGSVYAPDEAAAIEAAAREFQSPDELRNRLVAQRET